MATAGKEKKMNKKKLNITIVINAVELIKNTFEIKEEVRNFFAGTDYYTGKIMDEMEDDNAEQYRDLMRCADPYVLFDKYVSVDEEGLSFNYAEAAEGNDRAKCYFTIPCEFDLEQYIHNMDELNRLNGNDSHKMPASYINGWTLLDDSCFQYGKKMWEDCGLEVWGFIQMEHSHTKENCLCVRATTNVCLSDYSKEYIEEAVKSYYDGGVKEVERLYPSSSQQIICELLFESETGDNCHCIQDVENEAEAYSIIKRWLSEGGIVCESAKTLVNQHAKALNAKQNIPWTDECIKPFTREWYAAKYEEKCNEIIARLTAEGCPNPEECADAEFDSEANAYEIAGYYITHFKEQAYAQWMSNHWTNQYRKEARASFEAQDKEVTKILEKLYKQVTVQDIVWYMPTGTETALPNKALVDITGDELFISNHVIDALENRYGYTPIAFHFSYKEHDGDYGNAKLLNEMKSKDTDTGIGCYGVGSEACLTHCTGCDCRSEAEIQKEIKANNRALEFKDEFEMFNYIHGCGDLYNPILNGGTYVFSYTEEGAIAVHTGISIENAKKLAKDMKDIGENGWSAFTRGDTIYFNHKEVSQSEAIGFCMDYYSAKGWVRADEETFSKENSELILNYHDVNPVEWLVGISGSELNDVICSIVTGTTEQVKRYLVNCVQSDRYDNGVDSDTYKSGTENTSEVEVRNDGSLHANAMYRNYHMDYTAKPMSLAEKTDLSSFNGKEVA